ncbi:MAG: hypothetical protein LBQ47_02905 [Endomicrobium sp.]|jgi:hypothetical protein|nr:hypothetical protein [Endomicrobium sp.]
MKINLSQREVEYILFLINRTADISSEKSEINYEYSEDDLELIDKLEHALRIMEVDRLGLGQAVKNKPLN